MEEEFAFDHLCCCEVVIMRLYVCMCFGIYFSREKLLLAL